MQEHFFKSEDNRFVVRRKGYSKDDAKLLPVIDWEDAVTGPGDSGGQTPAATYDYEVSAPSASSPNVQIADYVKAGTFTVKYSNKEIFTGSGTYDITGLDLQKAGNSVDGLTSVEVSENKDYAVLSIDSSKLDTGAIYNACFSVNKTNVMVMFQSGLWTDVVDFSASAVQSADVNVSGAKTALIQVKGIPSDEIGSLAVSSTTVTGMNVVKNPAAQFQNRGFAVIGLTSIDSNKAVNGTYDIVLKSGNATYTLKLNVTGGQTPFPYLEWVMQKQRTDPTVSVEKAVSGLKVDGLDGMRWDQVFSRIADGGEMMASDEAIACLRKDLELLLSPVSTLDIKYGYMTSDFGRLEVFLVSELDPPRELLPGVTKVLKPDALDYGSFESKFEALRRICLVNKDVEAPEKVFEVASSRGFLCSKFDIGGSISPLEKANSLLRSETSAFLNKRIIFLGEEKAELDDVFNRTVEYQSLGINDLDLKLLKGTNLEKIFWVITESFKDKFERVITESFKDKFEKHKDKVKYVVSDSKDVIVARHMLWYKYRGML